jgi:hypothetical protein
MRMPPFGQNNDRLKYGLLFTLGNRYDNCINRNGTELHGEWSRTKFKTHTFSYSSAIASSCTPHRPGKAVFLDNIYPGFIRDSYLVNPASLKCW